MLGILGEAAFRTLLLAITVQLALWMLRIRRAQMLLAAWTVVLTMSLCMPALQWATPFRLPLGLGDPTAWFAGLAEPGQPAAPAPAPTGFAPTIDAEEVPPASWPWWEAAYLVVSGTMVLRLVLGVGLSLRLLGRATATYAMAAPTPRVRISPAITAPVTIGNFILLPTDAVDWPPAMRQAAIAHECAHVARGDFVWLVLSQLNRAVFWFNPVSWLLHRRLATLAELASDDHAIRVMGDRIGYAEVLLQMGRRSGPLLRGLAMARASTLHYRIERVLSDRLETFQIGPVQRSTVVLGVVLASVAVLSPELSPVAAPGPGERGQSGPALALSDRVTDLVPTTSDRARLQAEDVPQPVQRLAVPPMRSSRTVSQQSIGGVVAARAAARPAVVNMQVRLPSRAPQSPIRSTTAQPDAVAPKMAEAIRLPRSQPGVIGSTLRASADDASQARVPRDGHAPSGQPSLLKAIDQQTCNGVYLPGNLGGSPTGSGWGPVNVIRAKFFHEVDGTPWLKFYLGTRDPVNLPVKVTSKDVEFTAAYNTSFKMLPQGMNHLTGDTQRPNGTIDFACGEAGAHLFDRKS